MKELKMVLFLGGGGDIQDSIEIDTAFFSHLIPNDKILYIPVACDFTTYENCFVWFNSLVKKYTNIPSDNITMLLETSVIPNLNDYKAIYIGGGNTYKLLDYICKNNLDIKFKEYLKGSGIIFGGSAGAIIFGKTIETVIEEKENYPDNPALNMVKDYAIRCHYQPQDDKLFQNLSKKIKTPIIALPENGGLKIDKNNIKTIGNVFIFNNGIKSKYK